MRSAKETVEFPYSAGTVCYFEVDSSGLVTQIGHDAASMTTAYQRAAAQECRLYAVWPGRYRSDLFVIDDLNTLADAFGIARPDDHQHAFTWELSEIDDGTSAYAYVDVVFTCGCRWDQYNRKKLAADLHQLKGWDMATSTGLSYHTQGDRTVYTIRVRRRSLEDTVR